jgi:cell division protein FtsW
MSQGGLRRSGVPDLTLALATLMLMAVGMLLIYSASAILALNRYNDSYHFIKSQLMFMVVGLGLGIWVLGLPLEKLRRWATPAMIIVLAMLALVLIPGLGRRVGGARRWLALGPLGFQPSELAKLVLVVFGAERIARVREGADVVKECLVPVAGAMLLACGLLMLEPDFGSTVQIFLLGAGMLFLAGLPMWLFAAPLALAVPAAVIFVTHSAYRMRRVEIFLDPWKDPQGKGFQICHSLMAFGSGGLLGAGLGQGVQKLYYLPEPHTDFIFATAGEEFGFLGCLLILGIFLVFLWRGVMIALKLQDPFLKLAAAGITALFGLQVVINLFVVLGMAPTKGTTLPFLSQGGSALVIDLVAVALLLNLSRHLGESR